MSGDVQKPWKLPHVKLIKFMNAFHEKGEKGYKMSESGICMGIASMAAQAILAGELETFRNRLRLIREFVNSAEMEKLVNDGGYEEGYLKDQKHVDLKAFFDGVALYFQPDVYSEEVGFPVFVQQMKAMPLVYDLVKPTSSENYKLDEVGYFSGHYTKDNLVKYLNSLKNAINTTRNETLEKDDSALAFWLFSETHAIMLGYNVDTNLWNVIDANQLSKSLIDFDANSEKDMDELATIITNAFIDPNNEDQKMVKISTDIFRRSGIANNNDFIKKRLLPDFLDKDTVWQEIHKGQIKTKKTHSSWSPVLDILKYGSSYIFPKYSLSKYFTKNKNPNTMDLYTAVMSGNIEEVKKILKTGVNVNSTYSNVTPLYAAIYNGKEEIVQELLKHEADVNIKCNGLTALELANSMKNEKIINMLIEVPKTLNSIKK